MAFQVFLMLIYPQVQISYDHVSFYYPSYQLLMVLAFSIWKVCVKRFFRPLFVCACDGFGAGKHDFLRHVLSCVFCIDLSEFGSLAIIILMVSLDVAHLAFFIRKMWKNGTQLLQKWGKLQQNPLFASNIVTSACGFAELSRKKLQMHEEIRWRATNHMVFCPFSVRRVFVHALDSAQVVGLERNGNKESVCIDSEENQVVDASLEQKRVEFRK